MEKIQYVVFDWCACAISVIVRSHSVTSSIPLKSKAINYYESLFQNLSLLNHPEIFHVETNDPSDAKPHLVKSLDLETEKPPLPLPF